MHRFPVPPSSDKKAAEAAERAAREAPGRFAPPALGAAPLGVAPEGTPAPTDGAPAPAAHAAPRVLPGDAAPAAHAAPARQPSPDGHLDQIRAILFGPQRAKMCGNRPGKCLGRKGMTDPGAAKASGCGSLRLHR